MTIEQHQRGKHTPVIGDAATGNDTVPGSALWSSFLAPPRTEFIGYCFAGTDYVASESGMQQYVAAGHQRIGPGEDGCYVSVTSSNQRATIGTDYAGWHRLFYFYDGRSWAVADSYSRLIDHLTANGVSITPNRAVLASQSWNHTVVKQVSTFNTGVHGVKLLPSWCSIEVSGGRLRVVPREPWSQEPYRVVVGGFLERWVPRLQTLIDSDIENLSVDMTGGADSRVVVALVLAATSGSRSARRRVLFRGWRGPNWDVDWESSSRLAEALKVPIDASSPPARIIGLSTQESYDQWRNLCVGTYRPIYIPFRPRSLTHASLQGGAGENYRDFFRPGLYDRLVARTHRWVPRSDLGEQWYAEILSTLALLKERYPGLDPMTAHYREFRGRFHSGRFSLYRASIAPLVGKDLSPYNPTALGHAGAKINYDIMESLVPGLARLPYSHPSKAPANDQVFELVDRKRVWPWNPGKAYLGTPPVAGETEKYGNVDAWLSKLEEAARQAYRAEVIDLVGPEVARSASNVLSNARIDGGFTHETTAMDISTLISINETLTATRR